MDTALTKKELAALAGYSYQRMHTIDQSLPPSGKLFVKSEANEKKFDLAFFVQRWAAYNQMIGAGGDAEEDLDAAKAKHEVWKMRKTELEVARMEGEYVPLEDVDRMWSNICGTVASRLSSLPQKLAPSLVAIEDPDAIEAAIEREVREAMAMMANTALPGEPETFADAEPETDETEEDGDE